MHLATIGGNAICVNADHEQDALDAAVDYAEGRGWEGYFLDPNAKSTNELIEFDDVAWAGNHCRLLPSSEITIQEIPESSVTFGS